MRLIQSVLSTDPDERGMAPTWSAEHVGPRPVRRAEDTGDDGNVEAFNVLEHQRRALGRGDFLK